MPAGTTQSILPLNTIKNDVVVLKSGELRALLQISSLNFGLKAQSERDAILFEYQNFLNSLDFPLQIVVSSRLVNIDEYMRSLNKELNNQQNYLLRIQTQEYINFIETIVANINIMSTDFYVVIPFSTIETRTEDGGMKERIRSIFTLGGLLGSSAVVTDDPETFRTHTESLLQRVDFVSAGLHRMGLRAKMLTTQELLVLYWSLYNNKDLQKEVLLRSVFEE